jgi:hypothetical protein
MRLAHASLPPQRRVQRVQNGSCPRRGGHGIDFTYHGATGDTDAETAGQLLQAAGLTTSFRQELDGAWTVRFGPLPRDHMRAVLDHFAW